MTLPFEHKEYRARIATTKRRIAEVGADLLLVVDPANMNYLTGYNGWSFYTPQAVIVALDLDEPICVVRGMDANGARVTTFLSESSIIGYPDHYVQSRTTHPMEYVADVLKQRHLDKKSIGIETDTYYFSPKAYAALQRSLPDANWIDCDLLVNWIRLIKSPKEIQYMKEAAVIMNKMMTVAIESIAPGKRQCDVAAEIYHAQISGTATFGGDYAAFVPLLPTGASASTPHLTWSDAVFREGEGTIVELGSCRHRYNCALARTVHLGESPQKFLDTANTVIEGLAAALEAAVPGAVCEEVEGAWRKAIDKSGIVKESRIGYPIGLSYPPDWGEHTLSLRAGDRTVLQPNMTIHIIPGIWSTNWGIAISECVQITDRGADRLCDLPQDLVVKV